jgi:hypothetical protein
MHSSDMYYDITYSSVPYVPVVRCSNEQFLLFVVYPLIQIGPHTNISRDRQTSASTANSRFDRAAYYLHHVFQRVL